MMGSKIIFALDARADLSTEEKGLVSKYSLGKLTLYNSETRKRHAEAAFEHSEATRGAGTLGALYHLGRGTLSLAMASLSLKATIESLSSGQHIECKDMRSASELATVASSKDRNVVEVRAPHGLWSPIFL